MLNFTKEESYIIVLSIYLNKDNVLREPWQELIDYIRKYNDTDYIIKNIVFVIRNMIKMSTLQ